MGLAAHNYHSANEMLPAAYRVDQSGRPIHSWRTSLLPYFEAGTIFNQVNFSVAWDAVQNHTVRSIRVNTFMRPEDEKLDGPPLAKFLGVIGSNTPFPGTVATTFADATDGMSTTIMFGEVAESDILWMEPRDLVFRTMDFRVNGPRKKMGYGSPYGHARILTMDGAVRTLSDTTAPGVVRALVTSTGGEIVSEDGRGWTSIPSPKPTIEPVAKP